MWHFCKELFFPTKCVNCFTYGETICAYCLNLLEINFKRICPNCQNPNIAGKTHFGCQKKYGLDGLSSIFVYQGIIKKLLAKFKYQFAYELKTILVELFLSFCGEDKGLVEFIRQKNVYLTPIPLHWLKYNWRGFNQAELLGELISQKLKIGFIPNLLIKIKNTKQQADLIKKERLGNIKKAFKINHQLLKVVGKCEQLNIILFDDVWTTGATLRECAKVLKKQKIVKKIWGLTLAS